MIQNMRIEKLIESAKKLSDDITDELHRQIREEGLSPVSVRWLRNMANKSDEIVTELSRLSKESE